MTARADTAPVPLKISTETLLRSLVFIMLAVGSISFVEPSPYEILFLVVFPMTMLGHFVLTRVTLAFVFLVAVFLFAEFAALMPWLGDRPSPVETGVGTTATVYTLQTLYLFVSAVMFAVFFTRHTEPRLRLALVAYAISSVFAAAWAVAGFLALPGFHDAAEIANRIAGPFKDPNVLGSYSVLGVLCLLQATLAASARRRIMVFAALAFTIFGGIFLPLSRGAWGAMVFATLYFGIVTYATAESRTMRRRLVAIAIVLAILLVVGVLIVAADPTLSDIVTSRAKLAQDYDSGTTGRFGNQLRAIPMLMARPLGFGPHRFAFIFDLDPHNSYVGAFGSAGWVGGIFFLLLVLFTSFIGIRLTVRPTPVRRHAQVIVPALLSAFLQAVQIDIDHWRFIYFMMGAVWGMEAARVAVADRLQRARHRAHREPAPSPA